jgi:hypothetical protein
MRIERAVIEKLQMEIVFLLLCLIMAGVSLYETKGGMRSRAIIVEKSLYYSDQYSIL